VKLLANERSNQPATGIGYRLPIKEPRAERSDGPSERSALTRSRSQGNFLWLLSFLPEKKVTPRRAGAHPSNNRRTHQSQRTKTEIAAIKPQAKETATLHIAKQDQHRGPIKPLTCSQASRY
jgi:hypothetical protein